MNVSIREFKSHLSAWLNRVQNGESLTVTRRGLPIARVNAVSEQNETETVAQRLAKASWITPPSESKHCLSARDPVPGVKDGKTLADIIAKDRG